MKFFLTVEYTYRTATEFEADTMDDAMKKAEDLVSEMRSEVTVEEMQHDYALVDECGCTVVDWN